MLVFLRHGRDLSGAADVIWCRVLMFSDSWILAVSLLRARSSLNLQSHCRLFYYESSKHSGGFLCSVFMLEFHQQV